MTIKRIHWHWTAGGASVTDHERDSYNFLVQVDGTVIEGMHPPEAQLPPLRTGAYAAHTLNANSNAIGIAMDAMAGAIERPFNLGSLPLTEVQVEATMKLTAQLARRYDLRVKRDTMLSHAEVQPTLGIKQNGKWDIAWIPGMDKPGDPVAVGDVLRNKVIGYLSQPAENQPVTQPLSVLRLGSVGPSVRMLQSAFGLRADGIYGQETQSAVVFYQAKNKLNPDGVVGPATWSKILEGNK